ncbi:OmpA family protein [Cytophaga sp. FL35]|uniref:OmpA family protein n=1 Tax=Cytophaga sp. FL35 TaxID=1904456 RepID=UPI0016539649|nr:OmpA family protein [Cytophaga sp. FL35]MBC7000687.1 OmpA family protein [Cytophaga sp. FL35]
MATGLRYHIVLLSFFCWSNCFSQINPKKEAEDNFDHYGHMSMIEPYQGLLKKGYKETDIYKKLGNANYHSANYDVANYWYEKLLTNQEVAISPDYLYRYSLTLRSLKRYDEADEWMNKFNHIKSNDSRAKRYRENPDYLKKIKIPEEQFTIFNLEHLNSAESDFAPSFYKNQLVFTTARDLEMQKYNPLPYLNLYQASLDANRESMAVSQLEIDLNTKANESTTAFSKDGSTLFFTRNNYSNKKFKRDKKGISRLKIYRVKREGNSWSAPEDLPFNGTDYSVAHPTLKATGTKMYFASDMPGGKGASDLYEVAIHADGSFGEPINLGAPINTEGKETFPFISESGILYFASDGHPGLGGLDIFKVDVENKSTDIQNLGNPINSSEDDFSIVMDAKEKEGFFASNRKGGLGKDDIYQITRNDIECFTFISGTAYDKDSGQPLSDTQISSLDHMGLRIGETITASDGSYTIRIPCQEKQYQIIGDKDGYETGSLFMLTLTDQKQIKGTRLELEQSEKVASVGSDLVKILKLTPIYFDLNSSYLRNDAYPELDKVVDYMSKRPDIKIAVGSHTDSRESDTYNMWLSKRRAKRTVEYIISEGISASRVTGEGYGETRLLNKCSNGVRCSEKEHQLNRRSEFIIMEK